MSKDRPEVKCARYHVHVATGVVTHDIPAFGDIMVRARIWAEESAGNFVLIKGVRRLEK